MDLCEQDKTASTPDLELIGHTDDAEFALGMCSSEPLVASGGKDTNVSHTTCLLHLVQHALVTVPTDTLPIVDITWLCFVQLSGTQLCLSVTTAPADGYPCTVLCCVHARQK